MRVGLFGGSFDPIHRGHIDPVLEAVRVLELDRVLYLPTARPPHKPDLQAAPALLRYAMVEAALAGHRELVVSTLELDVERESYTVETVETVLASHPDWAVSLLVGADAWRDFHTYREWQRILERVPVVVLQRPGSPAPADTADPRDEVRPWLEHGRITFVENRGLDVSSRELRERLSAGADPPAGWLPEPVLQLIRKYDLYR